MSTNTYQKSVLESGSFVDGEWYCTCGDQVIKRTASTDAHKGKRFLRCKNSPQCRFFLWEEDEASARENHLQGPSAPQTPTRRTNDQSAAFPTPTSRHTTTAQRSGAASKGISATNFLPIPFQLPAASQSSGKADLSTKILGFLRDKNVKLSSSDELVLHNMVSTEVDVYELRLNRAEETIQKLSRN